MTLYIIFAAGLVSFDISLQLREQLFEQEKKLLQSQNEWLNSELNSKSEILLKLQKDRVSSACICYFPKLHCLLICKTKGFVLFVAHFRHSKYQC